jgi:hypothetical protein
MEKSIALIVSIILLQRKDSVLAVADNLEFVQQIKTYLQKGKLRNEKIF